MTTPFSDNPIMIGYDNRIFEGEDALGFRFPECKLITATGFATLDEIIASIKTRQGFPDLGYPIILNIGDSSTSGWNSERVSKGTCPLAPFFTYKTYSQLMEEQLFASVINAGVPGYSSYQGKRYLESLLRRITKAGIKLDYVTLYFGNNDGTYNQYEDKMRIDGKKPSEKTYGERVTVIDFEKNIRAMIELCREYGIKPIIIIPPVRYRWEPGIRSRVYREESIAMIEQLGDNPIAKELGNARESYQQQRYDKACEADRVLPRLKQKYRQALMQIAKTTKTPYIDVQSQIPQDAEVDYFVDYCHPTEKASLLIVQAFRKIRYDDLCSKKRLRQRMHEAFSSIIKNNRSPPPNVYAGI